ncbi:hypothetical protein [Priestia megaterium]|uniref:hypothetical protein n=1 Tax=Priestia megaterium TaxID=1404 RepID=UPI000BF9C8C9|nr:hypothetical protein [Priestia megaterium]PFA94149.1 hypothetical protein CN383_26915 [Priestia megaterium]
MSKISTDSNLEKLEQSFNEKVSGLISTTVKSQNVKILDDNNTLQKQVKKDIQVDVKRLSTITEDLIQKNKYLSDEEIAIELLKDVASNGGSKFIRKIASKMLKEKWWTKQ